LKGRLNIWLLLLVTVCGLSLWFGRDLVRNRTPEPTGEPEKIAAATDYSLEPRQVSIHLLVLNGTSETGLAREVSLMLGRAGCVTERVGNAPGLDVATSYLVNRRLSDTEAGDLARRLGGVPVLKEWDGRGGEDAVLVLGTDWANLTSALAKAKGTDG